MATKTQAQATADTLRPIMEGFARSSKLAEQSWLELQDMLPLVQRLMPDFYEAFANLMIGAFQSCQTIQEAADEIIGPLLTAGQASKQLAAPR